MRNPSYYLFFVSSPMPSLSYFTLLKYCPYADGYLADSLILILTVNYKQSADLLANAFCSLLSLFLFNTYFSLILPTFSPR
jgi:hypothetical protein